MKHNAMSAPPRTLGQNEARLLADLASQDKDIFTAEDARRASGSSAAAVDQLLAKLVKKRWLIRLSRGTYLIVPLSAGEGAEYSEDWFRVAKHLVEPAPYYLSHYSALEIHEMTSHPVLTVYISTPVRRKQKSVAGAEYRFVYAKPTDMWGVEDAWATPSQRVRVSDLERTIIDCLDRPELCGGVAEVAAGLWLKRRAISFSRLGDYVIRRGRKSVAKRLGFLLETFDLITPELTTSLEGLVTPSYVSLDPTLPSMGRHHPKWRVRVNLDSEEIRAATTT